MLDKRVLLIMPFCRLIGQLWIILVTIGIFLIAGKALAVPPVDITIDVDVTGPSTSGPLTLNRVELLFENNRGEITIPIKGKLKVKALINYSGNGVLDARWVVDGREIQQVNQVLTFGTDIVIKTQDIPPLPTFEPGEHMVTFRVISPDINFTIPPIRYFVDASPALDKGEIKLYTPIDKIHLYTDQLYFSWYDPAGAGLYRVIIWDGERSVVNAMTRDFSYRPHEALFNLLSKDKDYTWEIVSVDKMGWETGRSQTRSFRLRPELDALIFRDLQIKKELSLGKIKGKIPFEERFLGSRKIKTQKQAVRGDEVTLVAVIENWRRLPARQIQVKFKIDEEVISRQVIPELPSGEFTSIEALWTVPSEGIFNLTVEAFFQGEMKDTAIAQLDASQFPTYSGLDFRGEQSERIISGLDFVGSSSIGIYSGLDFTGQITGGVYTGLDFVGSFTGGVYGNLDFTGSPIILEFGKNDISGVDFTAHPLGKNDIAGVDFTIHPLGKNDISGIDFTAHPLGKNDIAGIDFTIHPLGKNDISGIDFTAQPLGKNDIAGVDFTTHPLGKNDISGIDFTAHPLGKNDIAGVDFTIHPLGKNDISGIDFTAHPLGKNDIAGIDFTVHPLGKNDIYGIDFTANPLGKNDISGVDFSAHPLGKNDIASIDFTAYPLARNDISGLDFTVSPQQNWLVGPMRELSQEEITLARSIFGDSLDYSRIRVTSMIGFSDRPWTSAAVPHPLTGSIELEKLGTEDFDAPGDILMNLLNVGEEGYTKGLDQKTKLDLTPNDSTDQNFKWADELFIHELTHIWQSQHGENGIEYMINSMLSQALRPDKPGCAYIFTPGDDFNKYGAEQIATIVEYYYRIVRDSSPLDIDTTGDGSTDTTINLNDLQPIIDIIQNALPNDPVPENIGSLSTPKQGCAPLIQLPF